jgi:succinoglycan biosynthesis transport protein ExoP
MEPNTPFNPSKETAKSLTGNIPFTATGAPFAGTGVPFTATGSPFQGTVSPFMAGTPPAAQQPAGQSDDFSFKQLVELGEHLLLIIRARWYWGVLGSLICGGLVGYFLFSRPRQYDAETDLLAQSTLDQVIGAQADGTQTTDVSHENDLRNHMSMMTSRSFRTLLTNSFTPEEKVKIAAPYLAKGAVADDDFFQSFFDSNIDIERERGREYYTITVTHTDPDVAIMVADRMASKYLDYVQEQYKEANLIGYKILEQQAEIIRADIAKVESARLEYQKKNGIISRSDNQSILTERLKRLDSSLTDIRVTRVGLETKSKEAHADRARSEYPWDNSYLALYANNPDLHKELDDATAQLAILRTRYGPNHPKVKDVQSQIFAIQTGIKHNFDTAVGDLDSQLDVARQTESLLKKEFDDAFYTSMDIEKLASTYEILSAGVDSKQITLEDLEKKIGEASVSSQLPANFMQIVDPAYLVKHKIPKTVLYGVFTAFIALGAFVGAPLISSAMDEKITGTSDLEKELGVTMVGAIPALKHRMEDRAHVVRNKLDLVTTEAFIGLVGQLEIGSVQRYPKVVVVTSTLPNEGKSLIASNLASTYQQLGKKVLLIDLDLRRPVQHKIHGSTFEKGFIAWMLAGAPIEGALDPQGPLGIKKLVDGTSLITSGGVEVQPSHYFVSEGMERLVGFMTNFYDVVLLDTPPAGVFQDALILSRYATHRVMVAREGIAPLVQVKRVMEDFAKANVPFSGLVLNGFIPRNANKKLAYGYKAATKGYSYGSESTKKSTPKSGATKAIKAAVARAS